MRLWTSPRCWATSNPNRLITPHTESGVALLFLRYRHTRFLMFVLPPTCAKVVDTTEGPAFRRAPPVALSIPYGLAELPPRGHVTQVRASHCHGLRCAAVQRNLGERGGEANDLLGLDLGRPRQSVGVGHESRPGRGRGEPGRCAAHLPGLQPSQHAELGNQRRLRCRRS